MLSRKKIQPPVYPFTAIVGQEEMKLALLLNVIDASIGGVLIMGHRGTGKSTAVRALADLLPKIERVRGCLYNCGSTDETNLCDDCDARVASGEKLARERVAVPVAELPLGATEDRVCGSLNIERALAEGVKTFEPGLLARANRGFLYIDEVNLLDDHLIDLLLDVAVTGRNLVEREGMSIEHPARFVLVGSGNPEEGELRPQLLDRFGLHVEVTTTNDALERVSVVERRDAFDRDPEAFRALAAGEQESLRRRITRARTRLHQVLLPRDILRRIAELCVQLKVDGHRGELTIARAARALAALEGRKAVSAEDVRRVATMALRHRLRRDPLEQTGSGAALQQQLDNLFPQGADDKKQARRSTGEDEPGPAAGGNGAGGSGKRHEARDEFSGSDESPARDIPPAPGARLPEISTDSTPRTERVRTTQTRSSRRREQARRSSDDTRRGRYTRAVQAKTPGAKIALDATLRATLTAGAGGQGTGDGVKTELSPDPVHRPPAPVLRYKRFNRKAGTLFIFAVDASGSMALNRIAQAKGALVQLLRQSYVKRDRVAVVSFRGRGALVSLRPSGSAARARGVLDGLGVGGATPLAAGLTGALEIARHERRRDAGQRIVLLLFTDGRANVSLRQSEESLDRISRRRVIDEELTRAGSALRGAGVTTVVVDTQNRFTSGGEGQRLAQLIGGRHVYLPPATAPGEQFASLVSQAR